MSRQSGKSCKIGLLIAEILDSYQDQIWSGIKDRANELGVKLLTFVGGGLNFRERTHIARNAIYDLINIRNIDVLILMAGPLSISVGVDGLQKFLSHYQGIPAVSVGSKVPGIPGIVVNNAFGMKKVVDHLIEVHNCKRIAFIKGPDPNEEAWIRFTAYRESLAEHNITYDPALIFEGSLSPQDGVAAVKTLLDKRKVKFDALIGIDDDTIIETITPLRDRGFIIPQDIKIAGFDNVMKSNYCNPSLTTISQPLYEIGVRACETAFDLFMGESVPDLIELETYLIVRQSCGCSTDIFLNTINTGQGANESGNTVSEDLFTLLKSKLIPPCKIVNAKNELMPTHYIDVLCSKTIEAYESKLVHQFTAVIEDIISETYAKGISVSYWSNILKDIIIVLFKRSNSIKDQYFLKLLWKDACSSFYRIESKIRAYESITIRELSTRLQRIGDWITSCFNYQDLTELLRNQIFNLLNINCCFFSLYKNEKKESELVFYYNERQKKALEGKYYPTINIFPDINELTVSDSFVILPLICEKEELGFICIEELSSHNEIYDFLAEKISRCIMGINMMARINNHTHELEYEVMKRTQELQKANNKLREQSFKDQLSGLWNRRFLMDIIFIEANQLLTSAKVSNDLPGNELEIFGILLIDLDCFKSINDTYGHNSGDMVLMQFARLLRQCVCENDYLVRMGGEEFLVVLKGGIAGDLITRAEKIRHAVEINPFTIENEKKIFVTCSIGCISFPVSMIAPEHVDFMTSISLADQALYYAKHNGRNQAIELILVDQSPDNITVNIAAVIESLDQSIEDGIVGLLSIKELPN